MECGLWDVVEAHCGLTAELNGVRAVVVRVGEGADRMARFMVLKRASGARVGRPVLVESGYRDDVREAMEAAEWALARHHLAA